MNKMRDLKRRGKILSAYALEERNDFILHTNRIVELISFNKKEMVVRYLLQRNPVLIFATGLLFTVSRGKMFKWLGYGLGAWRLASIIKKN